MKILGISAFYHDSAAVLTVDGEVLAAVQEERFTRIKHDPAFPIKAIEYCLNVSGLEIDDLDAIVYYEKPLLKFERLLETYNAFAPRGLLSFLKAIPIWIKEKMFLKKMIHDGLKQVGTYQKKKLKLLFPEHHLSHASSAFFVSPFEEAAIVTIDGVGEWATVSICHGKKNKIKVLKELRFPHSLGLLYSAFTYFLGFKVNSGEYKLMGLAPFGNIKSNNVSHFVELIKTFIIEIKEDGSIFLNQKYFDYATGLKMIKEKKWKTLFGFGRRKPESDLEQIHCDLAMAIQLVTEEVVLKITQEAKKLTNSKNLCLAGGVALNCVSNGKIHKSGLFEKIFIQPASGDAGGALGAALAANYLYYEDDRNSETDKDRMFGSYLGPEFTKPDTLKVARKYKAEYKYYDNFEDLSKVVAKILADGNVVGWFQGRMEFGPRALGNRSILGDPRNKEMQKKINLKIKYRESFRPFAPSILAEKSTDFFDFEGDSPYMLLVHDVKKERRKKLPSNYDSFSIKEKLYFTRSDIPAITHIDFSARIQTVHKDTNPKYWHLIKDFETITNYPLLINTSFNVRGEPIVCNPTDAYKCLMRTEMDYLVIGDFIFEKANQPTWKEKDNWQTEFKLD